ncbi:penicillin-binding protein 3 [Oceanobacillus oncorhynchi subsp. incaldanensis]|uniref:serine-type D-Ala-D-Ala carboxypeptidase n=1 Tax=Oceanobacillus aidingensis TaxID=645964 RepID=A0ABV9JZW4_9BACI|nr:penicillin-binding transpeptidase domain-containing protein [Oceanobacillus oncorhynchi]UUI39183.1 penicillin-binding transpeptidase domain-containing protein [Oceanobacillus oncorhynchi]GIO17912.1 penicillin-binding protein 3 [Oceanobacillus oncorhynchi subsp. incaldanensis]
MWKKSLWMILFIALLAGCSEEQTDPTNTLNQYAEAVEEGDYESLYHLFSQETKDTYSEEESALRLGKLYDDIAATDIEINIQQLEEREVANAYDDGIATIPFTVSMNTIAGEISFDYQAELTLIEKEDEEDSWLINWDSGFIFPDLADGGEIRISTNEPERGEILDKNQMPLAINDTVYEFGVIPSELGENEAKREEIARLLGMSVDSINSSIEAEWVEDDLFVPLKTILPDDSDTVQELNAIDGVSYREINGRVYPEGEITAHLVGYLRSVNAEDLEELDPTEYTSSDRIGARGLESLFEEELRGKKGATIQVTKDDGEDVTLAETEAVDGENITVTIDINIQDDVFQGFDEEPGNAAVIDPKTGETLALVSSPSFDPNDILYGTAPNYWADMEEDELQPMLNRSSSTFAPGSVIKPVTGAIGLKNGTIEYDKGIEIDGLQWEDYNVTRVSTSDGPVDLDDALVRSDNIYFAMKAVEMGGDAFVEGLHEFGVGEEFPYTYPVSDSTISNSGELDDNYLLAHTSYGQGEIEMSALHLATTYSAFLNNGDMIQPTLLTDEETGQFWKEGLVTEEQANQIQESLRNVVTEGTGKPAEEADFPISGKTGTAELKLTGEDSGDENSWFVGYPTDDQDLMIAIMVEGTKNNDRSSGVEKATEILMDIKE